MPKRRVAKPPLLDPKPTIGRAAFWALSRNLGSGTGPRGVLPKAGSGLETSVSGTLGLGRQTQTGGGFPELRLEDPRSTLEGAPEKDPIRRPDSEVGLGTPFGRGSQTDVGLNADFH